MERGYALWFGNDVAVLIIDGFGSSIGRSSLT